MYLWTAGRVEHGNPDRYWWRPLGSAGDTKQRRMEFTFWHKGQPDNDSSIGPENCVNIWPQLNFEWNAEPCRYKWCFVCEERTASQ